MWMAKAAASIHRFARARTGQGLREWGALEAGRFEEQAHESLR